MKDKNLEIRDNRNKSMFRMDDEYLNGYARLCGTNATLVYLCLCRHADRHQESYPSVQTIAEKIGISRDSVMRGIKSLIEWNIISKERERRENAKWLNNRYTLLDKSVWKPKPSSTQQHRAKSQIEASQVANQGKSQVAHSDTKDTHINTKDTHTKDIAETKSPQIDESLLKKREKDRKLYYERKELALKYYGNGNIVCAKCGNGDIDVLAIDHINGGGHQHRKQTNGKLYNWLVMNNYPDGFQILCYNCNIKKERIIKKDNTISSADVPLIIKEFESINPAVKRMYGNKTQRQACEDLINTYGLDRVLSIVSKTLPKTNKMPFFPRINTPLQLFEKWSALEDAVMAFQNKKLQEKNKYEII